jgi:hypothetical protein
MKVRSTKEILESDYSELYLSLDKPYTVSVANRHIRLSCDDSKWALTFNEFKKYIKDGSLVIKTKE